MSFQDHLGVLRRFEMKPHELKGFKTRGGGRGGFRGRGRGGGRGGEGQGGL